MSRISLNISAEGVLGWTFERDDMRYNNMSGDELVGVTISLPFTKEAFLETIYLDNYSVKKEYYIA